MFIFNHGFAFKCLVREKSGAESRALLRRIYKIISIKRIPLQPFLFSDGENLYDVLYFDYKFSNLKGAVSKFINILLVLVK